MVEASNVVSAFSAASMSIGPWGGTTNHSWAYRPKGKITEVVIRHGVCIDSLVLKSETTDGDVSYSKRFGGLGGNKTDKVLISTGENIVGLIVTVAEFDKQTVVHELCICTNVTTYGPFGSAKGIEVSIPIGDGCVVGFFGSAYNYINAIGIYVVAKSISSYSVKENKTIKKDVFIPAVIRELGPWGVPEGRPWDDGVFLGVEKVLVEVGDHSSPTNVFLNSIQIRYEKKDEVMVWSPVYGGQSRENTNRITVDFSKEVLIGIEGFYGKVDSGNGLCERITSLTFHTSSKKYGPYGAEIGMFFSSDLSGGEVVGFLGRSGHYLNAIGVHIYYN